MRGAGSSALLLRRGRRGRGRRSLATLLLLGFVLGGLVLGSLALGGLVLGGFVTASGRAGDAPAGQLYVTNLRDATISVIDVAAAERVASWPVEGAPHELALRDDAPAVSLYRDGRILTIDRADGAPRRPGIEVPRPHGLAVDSRGRL